MKFYFLLFLLFSKNLFSQSITLKKAQFTILNNDSFRLKKYNDTNWKSIVTNTNYELLGYENYNGYSWYRFHFYLNKQMIQASAWKDSIVLDFAKIDDCAEFYLNDHLIEKSGSFPDDEKGYISTWDKKQIIKLAVDNKNINWNSDNVMAIKVYDGGGGGGFYGKFPSIYILDKINGLAFSPTQKKEKNKFTKFLTINNYFNCMQNGILKSTIIYQDGTEKKLDKKKINIKPFSKIELPFSIQTYKEPIQINYTFTDIQTQKELKYIYHVPYILTPKAKREPKINAASIIGFRPFKIFNYKIPISGEQPIFIQIKNLPKGLNFDEKSGIITGMLNDTLTNEIEVKANNKFGKTNQKFTLKCGGQIALTPPMGWNSWNCWGLDINEEKVKASSKALINSGLINYGYQYINIDDGWEANNRNEKGELLTNKKFTDMKLLGNWLHVNGLKFGIYSSPGTKTCGGFLGSYNNELQDANTWANWGIDYLKYDWCSYNDIFNSEKDTTLNAYIKPYKVMQDALSKQNRDIIYSICQYGMRDVSSWGAKVNGNLWRTTGDIEDSWESFSGIGFSQTKNSIYAKPGNWNDPDMLVLGQIGWGANLHPTRLTPSEQYTHMSMWAMLAAPLMLGCDLTQLDEFTFNVIANNEVIAINQDILGLQATAITQNENYQVWIKNLADNKKAIAIFNMQDKSQNIKYNFKDLILNNKYELRDVWRQKNIIVKQNTIDVKVPAHGVALYILK